MISIIIPLYNQAKKLDKCLEGVKKQTYQNYEIVVINDRSSDSLSKIVEKNKNKFGYKIRFIHNFINHGAPYARNKGVGRSKGEYVIFCDADVIMEPNMLREMLNKLKTSPTASYAYSGFKFGHKKFRCFPFDAEKLRKTPYIHATSLIRREHFPRAGWDESLKKFQDWDLWLNMLNNGHTGIFIDKILFKVLPGGTMSLWLPSFAYRLLPFSKRVREYKNSMAIIKKKYNIR
ncbi:MAG: glycosyltransferase family A protein [bacterium]